MKLLHDLVTLTEKSSNDLSRLPDATIGEIRKNIAKGAKDTGQKWSNALELVHKAYEVAGVQRPMPDMKEAWSQYEEMLQYAVDQLAKYRGMNGDWRMSSRIFHEALENTRVYKVTDSKGQENKVQAASLQDLVESIKRSQVGTFDLNAKRDMSGGVTLTFSRFGIRKNYSIHIQPL